MRKLNVRQICFWLAAVLPLSRLIVYPATLSYRAGGDLLWPALCNLLAEGTAIALLLPLARRTKRTFFGLLRARLGEGAARLAALLLALLLAAAAVLPLLEQRGFVLQILYENVPSFLSFAPLFALLLFACTQSLRALGRAMDVALPLSAVCFPVLLLLALPDADFAALLPLFGRGGKELAAAALHSLPWYTGAPCLLCLIGNFEYEKGCAKKVLLAYAAGGAATLAFLAVFCGVFGDIAFLQHNALAQISKYATALTPLGRIDLLFIIALTLVLVIAVCVPVRLCVDCLENAFGGPHALHAALVCALLLGLTVLLDPAFREAQAMLSERMWPLFALFGYALPLLAALLLRERKGRAGTPPGVFAPPRRRRSAPPAVQAGGADQNGRTG